jgi:acylaminoacyl-peptidase
MRTSLKRALAVSLLLSLAAAAPVAQTRRGVTAEDYYSFEFLSDPRLSPDGRWAAYVVTTVDQRQNRRPSQIWLAATDGSRPPRQLTTSQQSSTSARWSHDSVPLRKTRARCRFVFTTGKCDAYANALSVNVADAGQRVDAAGVALGASDRRAGRDAARAGLAALARRRRGAAPD